jgi:hypothetical protein
MQQSLYHTVASTLKLYLQYLLTKTKVIFIIVSISTAMGLLYSAFKPLKYTARSSFVVEDSKSLGGSGLMGALSGQFGSEIMSALGGSNLLSGENILELAKSRSLLRKTLLTPYGNTNFSLADKYAESQKLKRKWENSKKVNTLISFAINKQKFTRVEDSLLNTLIDRIIKKDIQLFKPDRRLSLFEINITMRDEYLATLFCERLLAKTSDLYIDAKTKRIRGNVGRLQHLADSLQQYANKKIKSAAISDFQIMDINPQYVTENVNSTIEARDQALSGTIYSEVLKNLEISKASLLQETPTIQIVDSPDTPLPDNKIEWYEGLFAGLFAGLFLSVFVFVFLFEPTAKKQN